MSNRLLNKALLILPQMGLTLGLTLGLSLGHAQDISTFTTQDENSGNEYIRPEFGENLKKAQAGDVRSGKFFLRQKSEDPFNNYAVSYQLYQGLPATQVNVLKAFSLSGKSYSELVKTKFYKSSGDEATDDVDGIYFDGSSLYAVSVDSLYTRNESGFTPLLSKANTLVGTGAGGIAAASEKLAEENAKNDVNLDNQTKEISNRFGNTDEIRQGAGWAIAVLSLIGGGYMAYTAYDGYTKANNAVTATQEKIAQLKLDYAETTPTYENSQAKPEMDKNLKNNETYRDGKMSEVMLWSAGSLLGVGGGMYMVYF
jgi:hypothetical protein